MDWSYISKWLPFRTITAYFERKREAQLKRLRKEVLEQVIDDINEALNIKVQKSKGELSEAVKEFEYHTDRKKESLEKRLKDVETGNKDFLENSEKRITEMHKLANSSHEDAKKAADSAKDSAAAARSAAANASKAEQIKNDRDALYKEIKDYLTRTYAEIDKKYVQKEKDFLQSIDKRIYEALSKLEKPAKDTLEESKNHVANELNKMRNDYSAEVNKLKEEASRERYETIEYIIRNLSAVADAIGTTPEQRTLLIELAVNYSGNFEKMKTDLNEKLKANKKSGLKEFLSLPNSFIMKEIMEHQIKYKANYADILYKLDPAFKSKYDAAVKAKQEKPAQ